MFAIPPQQRHFNINKMKLIVTLSILLFLSQARAQVLTYGLLLCERGPIVFRQSSNGGEWFQLESAAESSCTASEGPCGEGLGVLPGHSGLNACSFRSECDNVGQTCLMRMLPGGRKVVEGCCKVSFEAWSLLGFMTTSGDQNPAPVQAVRAAAQGVSKDFEK